MDFLPTGAGWGGDMWISCLFASMKEVGLRMEVALLKRVGEEKRVLNDITEPLIQNNPEGNPALGLSRSVR